MSVPVAVWNKIEALEQAHAELAARLERVERDMYTDKLLESPAPAPDTVCAKCKGRKVIAKMNLYGDMYDEEPCPKCTVPTAEPEPAPLDPGFRIAIREAVVRMAALNVTVQEVDDITDAVIHTIRAYGRDGAR